MTRGRLPQLDGGIFLTDGGIETTLIFHQGLELPDFAAFPLLETDEGTEELRRYYRPYAELAREHGVGLVLESPTWRANPDWAGRLGTSLERLDELNRKAIALLEELRVEYQGEQAILISGCIGPQGDGYAPDTMLTAKRAETYHAVQIGTFADTAADLVTAITMTYAEEAIEQVDAETGGGPAYYMLNCAHPSHFERVLEPGAAWAERIGGLRTNASTKSHAELDEAEELDEGDPADLAERHAALKTRLPSVTVLGGCCGTDHRHVGAICAAWLAEPRART